MPVYNAAPYLSRCISSILKQDYQNLECILVNDGSTDGSLDICLEWAKKDPRIQVINQKNGGVSKARNSGIEASRGEFVLFVDSDDTIDAETIAYLINEQRNEKADIIIFGLVRHFKDGHTSKSSGIYKKRRLTFDDFIANFWDNYEAELTNSPTNKLFKSSIIHENNIEFPLGMKMGEDLLFNLVYLQHINDIFVTDQHFYHYQIHDDQATYSVDLRIEDDMTRFLTEIDRLKHLVEEKNDHKVNWREHYYQIFKHILTAINMGYRSDLSNTEQKVHLKNTIQQFSKYFDFNKLVAKSRNEKIIQIMLKNNRINQLHIYLKTNYRAKSIAKQVLKK